MVTMFAMISVALCIKTDDGNDYVSLNIPMFTHESGKIALSTIQRLMKDGAIKGKLSHVHRDPRSSIKYWVGVY